MADYSDQSDDDDAPVVTTTSKSKSTNKPLFAAATHGSSDDVYPAPLHSILKSTITEASTAEPDASNEPEPIAKKAKTTFASIITGGRSPSSQDAAESQPAAGDEASDRNDQEVDAAGNDGSNSNDTEHLSNKLFKRKRRIEFNTTRPLLAIARANSQPKEDEAILVSPALNDDSSETAQLDVVDSNRPIFVNFQKGESDVVVDDNDTDKSEPIDAVTAQLKLDICDLKDMLEAKVDFLCQDRAEVSPVQVIQIQMQVSDI